jgi:hypothetical protein
MSKVKIQGHSSGSGTVTITAPNTNSDRTISLPDSTDTLVGQSTTNALASDATALTTRVNAVGGRKNLIINGAMNVAQRGTGATTGGTYMTADRWKAGSASSTFEVVTNDRDLSIPNMMKVTSTSSGYGTFIQPIEGVQHTSGQNITLSFWAKTANFSQFRLEIQQNFGSGGSATVTPVNSASYFSVPDTGWNKYTATIAIPSISGKTVGAGSHLNILFGPNSGTNAGITYYSEVQLELGDQATDFEHRSYGEELALCQRYYEKVTATRLTGYHTTSVRHGYLFTTVKRTAPTVVISSAVNSGGTSISLLGNAPTIYGVTIYGSLAATSSGIVGTLTADAEL